MDNTSTIFDESKWLSFKKNLKKNVGESAFNNWLKHLNFVSLEETTFTFSVPTKFLRDWIVNNYSDKIKSEAKNHINNKVDTINCDQVLLSGGWSPAVHLLSHRGVKPKWNPENACFIPNDTKENITMIGSSRGLWNKDDCIYRYTSD